jgi:DNA primase
VSRISDEDVQRVRDATDIVTLISETVPLRQKGRLFWGLCPFHGEKTPSFKVDPATQLWHCFGCGLGGDVFGFLMRAQNLDFPDAVRLLADRARIEIVEEGGGVPRGRRERLIAACGVAAEFFAKQLASSTESGAETARRYLANRGLSSQVAKRWGLGYALAGQSALAKWLAAHEVVRDEAIEANLAMPGEGGALRDRFRDRIMFPIPDLQGRVIAFGGRVVGDGQPKYLNSSDTPIFHKSANLYAIDRAKTQIVATGTAVVVEGYTDVIALHEAGVSNAVATLGTALTAEHVKLLGRFAKRVVYLFDGDEAGMRAADRAAEFIDSTATPEAGSSRLDLLVAMLPLGQDPADLVTASGADAVRQVIDSAQPLLRFVIDRRLAAHDLASPEGRSRALASAAGVLASVRGSLLAQDYANYVAERLRTDYATVQAASRAARAEFGGRTDAAVTEEPAGLAACPTVGARAGTEKELLRELVAAPSLRSRVQDLLAFEGALTDPVTRRLVEAVAGAGNATGRALYEMLATTDREATEAISTFLVEPLDPAEAEERFSATSSRLKELALSAGIARLQTEMRSATAMKESKDCDELFLRIAAMQAQLAGLRASAESR